MQKQWSCAYDRTIIKAPILGSGQTVRWGIVAENHRVAPVVYMNQYGSLIDFGCMVQKLQ